MIIDSELNWEEQTIFVSKKISSLIGALGRVQMYLTRDAKIIQYKTLIMPHLSYCIEAWGSASGYLLNNIFKNQKKIIRMIDCKPFNCHTALLFREYNLLNLKN